MNFTLYCSFEHKTQVLASLRAAGYVVSVRSFGLWSLSCDPHEFAFLSKQAALIGSSSRLLYELRAALPKRSLHVKGKGA